jgi:hypothetical protein
MEHLTVRKSKVSPAKKSAKDKQVAKPAEFVDGEETDVSLSTEKNTERKIEETSRLAGPESSPNETRPRSTGLREESLNESAQFPFRERTTGRQRILDHDGDYEMSDENDDAGLLVDSDDTQRQHRDSKHDRNTNSERNHRNHQSRTSDRDRDSRTEERYRRPPNRAYVAAYVETDDEYEQPYSRNNYGRNGRSSKDFYQYPDELRNSHAREPSRHNNGPVRGSNHERNPVSSHDQSGRRDLQYISRPRHAYYRSDDEEASGSEYGRPRRCNDQASVRESSISLDPAVPPGSFTVPAGAEERLPSRYSGHPNPRRVNMMPGTVRITKTGKVAKTKKNRGANDPENITIVNLYDNEERSWAYIAKYLNDRRLEQGLKPGFSANGCNNRYNRTAPVFYAAEGRTFVPVCLRNRINRDDVDVLEGRRAKSGAKSPRAQADEAKADPRFTSLWNEALDKELLEAEEVVKEAHWANVAEMFNGKTGLKFTPQQLAFRRGMM